MGDIAPLWVNASSGVVHHYLCQHLRRVEFPVVWTPAVANLDDRPCHFCLDGLPSDTVKPPASEAQRS